MTQIGPRGGLKTAQCFICATKSVQANENKIIKNQAIDIYVQPERSGTSVAFLRGPEGCYATTANSWACHDLFRGRLAYRQAGYDKAVPCASRYRDCVRP